MSAPSIPKVKESFLRNIKLPAAALAGLALLTTTAAAVAHGVSEGDAAFLEESSGRNLLAFTYL
ncbi:MAG: hypothetical protein RR804_22670, partial [Massilia sp.]